MKVPKEIAEKARAYEALQKQANELHREVFNWLLEEADVEVCPEDIFLTKCPTGQCNGDGEYNDDPMRRFYLPVEGSDEYLGCRYATVYDLVGDDVY